MSHRICLSARAPGLRPGTALDALALQLALNLVKWSVVDPDTHSGELNLWLGAAGALPTYETVSWEWEGEKDRVA